MAGNGSIIIPNIKQLHENDHVSTTNVDYSSIRGKVGSMILYFNNI